jgi:hypothetical protein
MKTPIYPKYYDVITTIERLLQFWTGIPLLQITKSRKGKCFPCFVDMRQSEWD